jgi:hypothetical protein
VRLACVGGQVGVAADADPVRELEAVVLVPVVETEDLEQVRHPPELRDGVEQVLRRVAIDRGPPLLAVDHA